MPVYVPLSGVGLPVLPGDRFSFDFRTTVSDDGVHPDNSRGGTGPSTVAEWIRYGYDGWMPLDWSFSDSGAKFNSSQIKDAMQMRIGDVMLFPIYTNTRAQGANFQYYVVGWAGFKVTGFSAQGNNGKVFGHFESILWEGLLSESDNGSDDFGVRSIELVGWAEHLSARPVPSVGMGRRAAETSHPASHGPQRATRRARRSGLRSRCPRRPRRGGLPTAPTRTSRRSCLLPWASKPVMWKPAQPTT